MPNVAGRGGLLQHAFQPGLRPGYRPIRGSGRHPITQLNAAGTSVGWVSRHPKALAEAREKLSLSFVIILEVASGRGAQCALLLDTSLLGQPISATLEFWTLSRQRDELAELQLTAVRAGRNALAHAARG